MFALVAALTIVSCGGDDSEPTDPNPTPTPEEQDVAIFKLHFQKNRNPELDRTFTYAPDEKNVIKGRVFTYAFNEKVKIKPILFGGEQQKNVRSGTENVPGIKITSTNPKNIIIDFKAKNREKIYQEIYDSVQEKFKNYKITITLDIDSSD